MIQQIKKLLIKTIGFSNYREILVQMMRIKDSVSIKVSSNDDVIKYEKYFVPNRDCFFGYYDLQSLNNDKTKLLSHVIEGEQATVGYFNVSTKQFVKIASTSAWNWQMGARLQWYKDDESIVFNDFDGNDFISKIVNLKGEVLKTFKFPIFDLDKSNGYAYFTDFTILHHLRRGYGYGNKNVDFESYYDSANNGLFRANLNTGKVEQIISIKDIIRILPKETMSFKYHYINHITVNKQNGDVMFFHLCTNKSSWYARMFFFDMNGKIINVIDDFDRVSHYDWYDESHILVTLIIDGKTQYRLYNYHTKESRIVQGISTDGYPTVINNDIFITDTYANHYGMQSVYVGSLKNYKYKNIFSIYHSPRKVGEHRCDLHPRIQGNLINIDSVAEKHRSQYIISTGDDLFKGKGWITTLSLDRLAFNRQYSTDKRGLFSCIKSEYLYLTNRPCGNWLKMLYLYWISPTFKVNVLIRHMQNTHSSFKRRLIRNKLETHHGMIIDHRCTIGKHFRAEHPIGIVIGSGAVLGNFCKLYQNVTIGQKEGKFPKIGDDVTIYAGACIIGDITIGNNAVIGANAVVINDVPENSIAVGVPAHIIGGKK